MGHFVQKNPRWRWDLNPETFQLASSCLVITLLTESQHLYDYAQVSMNLLISGGQRM